MFPMILSASSLTCPLPPSTVYLRRSSPPHCQACLHHNVHLLVSLAHCFPDLLQYFFFTPGAILIDIIQLLTYPRQSLWVILMFASVLAKLAGESSAVPLDSVWQCCSEAVPSVGQFSGQASVPGDCQPDEACQKSLTGPQSLGSHLSAHSLSQLPKQPTKPILPWSQCRHVLQLGPHEHVRRR